MSLDVFVVIFLIFAILGIWIQKTPSLESVLVNTFTFVILYHLFITLPSVIFHNIKNNINRTRKGINIFQLRFLSLRSIIIFLIDSRSRIKLKFKKDSNMKKIHKIIGLIFLLIFIYFFVYFYINFDRMQCDLNYGTVEECERLFG